MKKSELITGMIIQDNEGKLGMVMLNTGGFDNDIIVGDGNNDKIRTWYPMKFMKEELQDSRKDGQYSVVKVWGMGSNMYGASIDVKGSLIWELDQPIIVKLNEDYKAEVLKNGDIKVGCQTIPVKAVRELLKQIDENEKSKS